MEEIDTKVEQTSGHGLVVNKHMLLLQVPASWSHEQGGHILIEFVFSWSLFEGQGSSVGLNEVLLA